MGRTNEDLKRSLNKFDKENNLLSPTRKKPNKPPKPKPVPNTPLPSKQQPKPPPKGTKEKSEEGQRRGY